jgi:hypothetical protein
MGYKEFLDDFDDVLNNVLLSLLILLEVWYFLRFKFRLEKMALIVLISDLCLFIVRIFIPEGEEDSS